MALPFRLLMFALSVTLLFIAGCDALSTPDDPGDDPDPTPVEPPQTFDDTPVALQTVQLQTATTVFTLFNTGFQGASTGNTGDLAFSYNGFNGLYEGQLLIGVADTLVSGQPYSVQAATSAPNWTEGSALASLRDTGSFDQGYRTRFTDAGTGNPASLGLTVTQWAYASDGLDGAVVLVYDITNGGPTRDAVYVGLFADFDVAAPETNRAGFDTSTRTVYTYGEPTGGNPYYYGVSALSGPLSGWSVTLGGLASGLTDGVLFAALTTTGTIPTEAGDRRSVVGAGPFRLAAGATQRVAFAYVAGEVLSDLLSSAAAARSAVASLPTPMP